MHQDRHQPLGTHAAGHQILTQHLRCAPRHMRAVQRRTGRQNHQIEGMGAFDLEPAHIPIAGFIRGIQRLRHDTFMSCRERGFIEAAGGGFH